MYSLNLGGQDGNGIYYSSNQGNDWKEIYKNNSSILLSISFTEQGLLWAVGKEGRILKYNGEITDVNGLSKNYDSFKLYQNYPNPFNPSTKISYIIPNNTVIARSDATWQSNVEMRYIQSVRLIVYDILGREVATLVNQKQKPGNYEVEFNARNLKSGIYFYRISAGSYTEVKKMILLK